MLKENMKKWGGSIIGQTLKSVHGLIYSYNEDISIDHPQEIKLEFESIDFSVKLLCGPDGASLLISELPMIESDMGEYGKNIIKDMSEHIMLSNVINKKLTCFSAIYSGIENIVIGFKFDFFDGIELDILNLGDEIHMFNMIPQCIFDEECMKYIPISLN